MNHRSFAPILLPAFILLAAGCGQGAAPVAPQSERGSLSGSNIGGPFSLIDQDGRRVRDTDFAGRYRLVYFGFANCPDVCPVDLAVIGAGLRQFEAADSARAAKVQPIFITVDPERDTPTLLKRYVANFHPRLIGLTGSRQEIEAATSEYGVYAMKGEPQPGGGYNVDHSRIIMLFGPQGEPIAIVPHESAELVAAELARWVR
jgi:protein SCO1/2